MMKHTNLTKRAAVFCVAGLALATAACGSDDDGGGLTDDQQFMVDDLTSLLDEEGFDYDKGCIEEFAAQISAEDAALFVETEGEGELSEEAAAIGEQVFTCVDLGE